MTLAPSRSRFDGLEVERLCAGALDFLPRSFDPGRGLCSFKAELAAGGELVQDWSHWVAPRYTITSLLGLHAAGYDGAARMSDRFLQLNTITNPADKGLLTVLHCERDDLERAAVLVPQLHALAGAQLEMQDLAWLLWGACAAARAGIDGAEAAASALLARMLDDYVHPRTGLPRHSLRPHRRGIVSFGSLVYFLRALHEAAWTFGDRRAETLFRSGVATALALQGPQGEWPWMIDVVRGRAFDRYPVFSVHQDSMAILFLRPAAEAGVAGAASAIERSVRWVHGENELGLRFYLEEPFFFAYRAVERDESSTKARRYGRWLAARSAAGVPASRLRVNRECRSYHLGWILYAWSGCVAVRQP
ncbi:MAG: hypothetical protein QOK22_2035 [Gaiellaceae bacterium]|nr:hypothetical protein [Gaiellaceae bacterium]